ITPEEPKGAFLFIIAQMNENAMNFFNGHFSEIWKEKLEFGGQCPRTMAHRACVSSGTPG
ncbi:MAG: hypothetical protein MR828_08705, partial [Clostridiales bacterium]|nr:hypothetical protein [Clostridiales bacterium]